MASPIKSWSAFSSRPATVRVSISALRLPRGPLVLLLDGLYFRFLGRLGLVCDGGQAVPSKSSLLPRSCASARQRNLRAGLRQSQPSPTVYTDASGPRSPTRFLDYQARYEPGLDRALDFHLISRLQYCRGRRNRRLEGRPLREALYQHVSQALELPDVPRLQTVLKKLRHLVRQATVLRVMRIIVLEFLRQIDHFRAYRKYPKLNLPTTTRSV